MLRDLTNQDYSRRSAVGKSSRSRGAAPPSQTFVVHNANPVQAQNIAVIHHHDHQHDMSAAGALSLQQPLASNVGAYLSRVVDVQQSGRVHPSDVLQFMEALQIISPNDRDHNENMMERAVIQMLLEQIFRSADRLEPLQSSDGYNSDANGRGESVASSSLASSFRSAATVSVDTCALVFNRILPATSMALTERLEMLEQATGGADDRETILDNIDVLEDEMRTIEGSIGRYEVLIGQCQKALEARRVASHPLTAMVHEKLFHQETAETTLQEKQLAEVSTRSHREAAAQLVTTRSEEVESWRARMSEWKVEMRTVGEDLETTKAEEEILLKRLDSLRQHRASLEEQLGVAHAGASSCQESLDRALETWQDAVSIAAEASTRHQATVDAVDDAKATIMAIERGIEVARGEFSLEKAEAESILQRYHLLCAERRKLREALVQGTLNAAALKNTLASLVERSPPRRISMPLRNERVVSVLIDELRAATEVLESLVER